MNIEKLFKREDGSKTRLIVRIGIDFWDVYRQIDVMHCPAGKRIFSNVHNTDNYSWRKLNAEDRKKAILDLQLEYVTEQEINEACLELSNKIYEKIAL